MKLTYRQIEMLEAATEGRLNADFTEDLSECGNLRAHFNGRNYRTYLTLTERGLLMVDGPKFLPTERGLGGIT